MQILNISDPQNITYVDDFDTRGNANDVEIMGNLAYVADGGQRFADPGHLESPQHHRTLVISTRPDMPLTSKLWGTWPTSPTAANGLQILDITNPQNITYSGWFRTQNARDVEIVGDLAYVADGTGGLRLRDLE